MDRKFSDEELELLRKLVRVRVYDPAPGETKQIIDLEFSPIWNGRNYSQDLIVALSRGLL